MSRLIRGRCACSGEKTARKTDGRDRSDAAPIPDRYYRRRRQPMGSRTKGADGMEWRSDRKSSDECSSWKRERSRTPAAAGRQAGRTGQSRHTRSSQARALSRLSLCPPVSCLSGRMHWGQGRKGDQRSLQADRGRASSVPGLALQSAGLGMHQLCTRAPAASCSTPRRAVVCHLQPSPQPRLGFTLT